MNFQKTNFKQTDENSLLLAVIDSVHEAPITNRAANGSITVVDSVCKGIRAIVWDYVMHPVQVVEDLDVDTALLLDEKPF